MKVTISGQDFDLSFQRRVGTIATLRRKGKVVAKAASVKHPRDEDNPAAGRKEALRNLVKGKGTTGRWSLSDTLEVNVQYLQAEERKKRRRRGELLRLVNRISKIGIPVRLDRILGGLEGLGEVEGLKPPFYRKAKDENFRF